MLDHTILENFAEKLVINGDDMALLSKDGNVDVFNEVTCSPPNFDFLLISHGGLKGTSKAIYYRVLLNENYFWGPAEGSALTRDMLEICTYHMCWKDGEHLKR